jgi:hypothetical protein
MARQEINWQSVCTKLPKRIFNAFFSEWKTQEEVSAEFGAVNYPHRHVSKYKTLFLQAHYLELDDSYDEVKKRRVKRYIGTVKPYLDYIKEKHPQLYTPKLSILLQMFNNHIELRKIILKDDRDIIQGINDFLLLYWHTKNIIRILKPFNKDKNLSLLKLLNDSDNYLSRQFIEMEEKENSLWNSIEEQEFWWSKFIAAHSIDSSYMQTFQDIIKRINDKGVRK